MVKDTKQQALLLDGVLISIYISHLVGILHNGPTSFAIRLLHGIFLPLQGFWNCIAFIRPRRFKIVSLKDPNTTLSSQVAQDIVGVDQCSTLSTPLRQCRLSVDAYSVKRGR